jgi:hypothetical protein
VKTAFTAENAKNAEERRKIITEKEAASHSGLPLSLQLKHLFFSAFFASPR